MTHHNREYRIGGLRLPNPIVVASSPATEDRDRLMKCADAGAAAAVLKSCHVVGVNPKDNGSRRFRASERGLWGTSTIGRELLHPEEMCSLLDYASRRSPFAVIPSVAGFSLEISDWIETLHMLEPLKPSCVQLDLFYLDVDLSLPQSQNRLRDLILGLKRETHLDLLPKLNQELRPGAAFEVFRETGICGWSLLDSVRTHLPVRHFPDKEDFPKFQFASGLNSASLFGPWQLPLVCDYVSRLRSESSLPILAGGGVYDASDVLRLISLGAAAVQVATAIIRKAPGWIRKTLQELKVYRYRECLDVSHSPTFAEAQAHIKKGLCSSCGRCAAQLMCNAIEMGLDGPRVIPSKCEGCGFCLSLCEAGAIVICPVHEEISLDIAS